MRYLLTALLAIFILFAGCIIVTAGPGDNTTPQPGGGPVIVYFNAAPTDIQAGGSSTVSWKVTGASSIKIVPEIGPADPEISITIYPQSTATYTLTASNAAGTASQSLVVRVADAPATSQQDKTALLKVLPNESGSVIKNITDYTRFSAICAGDNVANLASRAFLSFDISSLPQKAVVSEAVLDFTGYTLVGNPTYSTANWGNMGALQVYQSQYGAFDGLGRLGYDATAPISGSLRLNELSGAPLKLDVTSDGSGRNMIERLLADGQGRCQFRVQFFTSTNWNTKTDMICLDGAVLRVKYSLP
jgi:hypothetical protein